jgi:hypothetical protein
MLRDSHTHGYTLVVPLSRNPVCVAAMTIHYVHKETQCGSKDHSLVAHFTHAYTYVRNVTESVESVLV